ncbi:MAG: radical SAM family heme chaperone HemW [Planctomycetota bacterium]
MLECNAVKHPQQAIPTAIRDALDPAVAVDALYLHLPFCFHKCHYCDFYSVVEQPGHDRQAAFTDALIAELRGWAEHLDTLSPKTVFAGGGTPTYLRPELWAKLLDAMHELGLLDRCEEFTVEANPETVTPELMQQLADGGVNRASIGAQSFQRESLEALERWHDPDNVPRAVDACRAAGIDNFSLDLIFAIPGQTLDMLDDDLSRLIALAPTHLSTYGLTYEPNTALTARLRVGKVTPIDEDTQRQMYQRVLDRLEAEGFEHYEVSNWAKTQAGPSNLRCVHNLAYWQNQNWLGLGPAAASHVEGHRWRNAPNLATYLATSPEPATQDHESLPDDERVGERLMLGLRLSDGIDLDWIDEQLPTADRRRETIQEMVNLDMLERTATHLRLTRRGLFVADNVIAKLL